MKSELFYKDFPGLDTARLIIRKYTIDDVDDYFIFASDPKVTKYLRWGPHPRKSFTSDHINEVLQKYESDFDTPWGIENKKTNRIIGTIHAMDFDSFHRKVSLGIVIAREFWGNGYAKETLKSVFNFCFVDFNINRIETYVVSENQRAVDLMQNAGMVCEGVLRQYSYQKGELKDFKLFSLLAQEYIYDK